MRELKFKQSGLLFYLAVTYGGMDRWITETNICTYFRRILLGFVMWLGVLAMASTVAVCVGDFGAWVFAMLELGQIIRPSELAFVIFLILILAAGITAGYVTVRYTRYAQEHHLIPAPIAEGYKAWKEKTCVRVRFE